MTRNPPNITSLAMGYVALLGMALTLFFSPLNASEPPTITSDGSTAGYVTLSWADSGASKPYKLQQKTGDGEWQTIYEGIDTGTTLTGLSNGAYKFRINSSDPATVDDEIWSEAIEVNIAHHSLAKALAFFVSGLIIFATLIWLLFFIAPSTSSREA